jgi:hypothetical protein
MDAAVQQARGLVRASAAPAGVDPALLQGSTALMMNPNQVKDGAAGFLARCFRNVEGGAKEADDDVGEVLCDCEFSLAYGAKILLNQARMHLRRGMRYDVLEPAGAPA